MHVVMQVLAELQKIEFGRDSGSSTCKAAAEKLRAQVPPQILGHYDRLRARGKKGLALVRENKVCAECHVGIPIGTFLTIVKGDDIQLCGNCGRYLYVEEKPVEPPPAPPKVEPAAPKAKRGRKPKKKPEDNAAE